MKLVSTTNRLAKKNLAKKTQLVLLEQLNKIESRFLMAPRDLCFVDDTFQVFF